MDDVESGADHPPVGCCLAPLVNGRRLVWLSHSPRVIHTSVRNESSGSSRMTMPRTDGVPHRGSHRHHRIIASTHHRIILPFILPSLGNGRGAINGRRKKKEGEKLDRRK
jgi:hypothetical protein